jgi:hypothetical protein
LVALPQASAHISYCDPPPAVLQPNTISLIGVFDGLFSYMPKIINIRNKIRGNIQPNTKPVVEYILRYQGADIDTGIRE